MAKTCNCGGSRRAAAANGKPKQWQLISADGTKILKTSTSEMEIRMDASQQPGTRVR